MDGDRGNVGDSMEYFSFFNTYYLIWNHHNMMKCVRCSFRVKCEFEVN